MKSGCVGMTTSVAATSKSNCLHESHSPQGWNRARSSSFDADSTDSPSRKIGDPDSTNCRRQRRVFASWKAKTRFPIPWGPTNRKLPPSLPRALARANCSAISSIPKTPCHAITFSPFLRASRYFDDS